jgi:hypothetical protein
MIDHHHIIMIFLLLLAVEERPGGGDTGNIINRTILLQHIPDVLITLYDKTTVV